MQFIVQPYHILVAALIGRANEHHQRIIEFQNDQIQVLLKQPGKQRALLTDDQRRVLGAKGHAPDRNGDRFLSLTPDCQRPLPSVQF